MNLVKSSKEKKTNNFINLLKKDLRIVGKRRSNPTLNLMMVEETEKKEKSSKDLKELSVVSEKTIKYTTAIIEEPILEEADPSKFPYNITEQQMKILLKLIYHQENGFPQKIRLVKKKSKNVETFSSSDAISWFDEHRNLLYSENQIKNYKITDCILLGRLLQNLGVIENVSSLNSFERDDSLFIFNGDLSNNDFIDFYVGAFKNFKSSKLKRYEESLKEIQKEAERDLDNEIMNSARRKRLKTKFRSTIKNRYSFPFRDEKDFDLMMEWRMSLEIPKKKLKKIDFNVQYITEKSLKLGSELTTEQLISLKKSILKMKLKDNSPMYEKIMYSIYMNDTNLVKEILQEDSSILISAKNLLHFAAMLNRNEVLQVLLNEGIYIDMKDKSGRTGLHIACQFGSSSSVSIFILHGASLNEQDYLGNTPLHLAFENKFYQITEKLMEAECDVTLPKINGRTVLHDILHQADLKGLITYLNFHGDNISLFNTRDLNGNTPFMLTVTTENDKDGKDCIGLFIKNKKVKVMAKNNALENFIHLGIAYDNWNLVQFCLNHIQGFAALLCKSRDINGNLPFHLAAKYGNIEALHYFLKMDIPIDIENNDGLSPIHLAKRNRNVDKNLFQLMIEKLVNESKAIIQNNNDTISDHENSEKNEHKKDKELNTIKSILFGLIPKFEKKTVSKHQYLLNFDYSESEESLQNQVLAFAKFLRDDENLNKLLKDDDKSILKNMIKDIYELMKIDGKTKKSIDEECKKLEEKVNELIEEIK
eukprot:gene5981-9980_t